jgi:peptidoglycan/xylan/chitin deacetylase (PgdA/CDA1 family)
MKPKRVYVLVTIDTECDKGNPGWNLQKPLAFTNIPLQKELLMPLFKEYGIIPTFLLSPEVLQDKESVKRLKRLENVDLGTHLHEEFIEPLANYQTKTTKNVQANLTENLEREKLVNLTEMFYKNFGYPPKSFRSGRFGRSKNTSAILADLGYKAVSDITPYTYKFIEGNLLNYWGQPLEPYWERFGEKQLIQVPLTLINPDYHKVPFFLRKDIGNPKNIKRRIFKKLGYKLKTRWLRPFRESGKGMIEIADYVLESHFTNRDYAILNIMFHSNEILVKGSPYCQTDNEVKSYIASLKILFEHLKNNYDLCSIGLGDVSTIWSQD